MTTTAGEIARFAEAKERGAAYLAGRQQDDGVIGDPAKGLGSYYKAPWALAAAGRAAEGASLVAWIRRHMLSPEGDLRGDFERGEGFAHFYPYPNAWVICAAQKLGQFDVARRGIDFLATLQHAGTGGFRSQLDKPEGVQDIMSTSQAGMAALYTGRLDLAEGVARFLRRVSDEQPDPERALYFIYKPDGGLKTDFPEERARLYAVRAGQPRERFYMIGIAAAFLTKYGLATGESDAFDLAARYLDFALRCSDAMYETAQVGKVGWGAALLAGATGEERYRALAVRAGEALLAQQNDGGSWDNTGGFTTQAVRDEITAEFVAELDEMILGLSAG